MKVFLSFVCDAGQRTQQGPCVDRVNTLGGNVDVYPQKQQVLDALCVWLINIPVLIPVLLLMV